MSYKRSLFTFLIILILYTIVPAQDKEDKSLLNSSVLAGIELRSIGPAKMSGRIADIAIDPNNEKTWYVAVGSGGVWKTTNSGITWDPLFDSQPSYSIGCVTIDPGNTNTIWVGTGENVGGRHVGYGDGIYKSLDAGKSWKNMGLKGSEHISKIIVHPKNSDIIWVAAQGPLWNKGDERGLYKSVDGGETWKKTLGDDEWVGVTDIVIDPRNSDMLYAATWQRHRNIAAYMGGGPGSDLHKSTDGGETWTKLTKGLPNQNMGKIGLAISPQNPDVLYAAIELDKRTGGIYRSDNRGSSWQKMSDEVSGATGPHYYQELYASPHKFDRIYLANVVTRVSEDGGRTFTSLPSRFVHSDHHAMAFKKNDPDCIVLGTDGGVYETIDLGENWRFMTNLPLTQFYKVAVDDAEPFYNIYGGTQDNNTLGGPSRTLWGRGILNSDWWITIGGDGHQPATEPGNPNIIYSESQQGYLWRIDVTTGERILIQPQPEAGEEYERFNWDSPILVSSHNPSTIYFASQRIWKSENRGDSWTTISGDLTKDQERISLPIMNKKWGYDEPWDMYAMSNYNTITSLAESPLKQGMIYAGTDDGLIQVTEDGGKSWRKIELADIDDIPATSFVNDIKADLFDVNTVYVVLDNHKYGDFNPYLIKSTDKGISWEVMKGDLPDRTLVWRIVQDHVKPELFFLATEFGIYFTVDSGEKWIKLTGGVPTISFRDLAIQRRENDLVGASFGRGFYIFDDYSFLRDVSEKSLQQDAMLFQSGKAWWYLPRQISKIEDASVYRAPNPPYGAVFTYYVKESMETIKGNRKKEEGKLEKGNKDIAFPGWNELEKERLQDQPNFWLVIKDDKGNVIRRITAPNSKGFHRITWDMRYPATDAITKIEDVTRGFTGSMVAPGKYTATLYKQKDGVSEQLAGPVDFTIERMYEGALPTAEPEVTAGFWRENEILNRSVTAAIRVLDNALERVKILEKALLRTTSVPGEIDKQAHNLKHRLYKIEGRLRGNRSKSTIGEKNNPSLFTRTSFANSAFTSSTYGPTPAQKRSLELASDEFNKLKADLDIIVKTEIPQLESELEKAGAPWFEGQPIPEYPK